MTLMNTDVFVNSKIEIEIEKIIYTSSVFICVSCKQRHYS